MGWAKQQLIEQQERGWSSQGEFVCSECVLDYALKALIEADLSENSCDFCGRTSSEAIAAATDIVIGAVADGLYSEYEDPVNHVAYDSAEGGYQMARASTYDLLGDHGVSDDANLTDVIVSAMETNEWVEIYPYGPTPTEALVWGWQHFREYVMHTRRFTFLIPDESDEGLVDPGTVPPTQLLAEISKAIVDGQLTRVVSEGTSFWRARPHAANVYPRFAKELGSAPAAVAQTNRMSPAGVSVFYGASSKNVAMGEVDGYASADDAVTVGQFTTTAQLTVVDLVNLPSIPSLFDAKNRHRRAALQFLREFAADAAKVASPDDRQHLEYIPTQIVSEYLRYNHIDGHIDGVQWRSTKDPDEVSTVLFLSNDACVDHETAAASAGRGLLILRPGTVQTIKASGRA